MKSEAYNAGREDARSAIYRPDQWGEIGSIRRAQYLEGYNHSPDVRALEAAKRPGDEK